MKLHICKKNMYLNIHFKGILPEFHTSMWHGVGRFTRHCVPWVGVSLINVARWWALHKKIDLPPRRRGGGWGVCPDKVERRIMKTIGSSIIIPHPIYIYLNYGITHPNRRNQEHRYRSEGIISILDMK